MADSPFDRAVDILLDAAFDDACWGDAFRVIDRPCSLNCGQYTALAASVEG